MMQGQDSPSHAPRRRATQRPNPASTGRRLKRNVRVGGRRTTIVLEAYVWDSIDSMLVLMLMLIWLWFVPRFRNGNPRTFLFLLL